MAERVEILVVDDDPLNRMQLVRALDQRGYRTAQAGDGEQALEALSRDHFDLVILDILMPVLDGFKLADRIKKHEQLAKIPIILLTLTGERGDAARCRQAGVEGYLSKPFSRSELIEAIQSVLGNSDEEAPLVTRHSLRELDQRLRVLLAEDNPVNQRLAVLILERLGCQVDVAGNGREAVEMAEGASYDLVFMDCQMPELNGYEATREIRRRPAEQRVPVIAMTANAMPGDRRRCLEAGMDDYVSKPVRPENFEAILARWAPEPGSR